MLKLRASWLLALAACCPFVLSAACVTDDINPGCVHFMMRTDSRFDVYTSNPSQATKDWINSHFWRMQESYGFFDPAGVVWDPNTWAYVNSSSFVTSDAIVTQHPEWILKSGPEPNGTKLYNGFVNSNGLSSRYAFDIGDPGYRAWWISYAQGVVARGYKGLWIDDVNFDNLHTSDINGNFVLPWDDRTGALMTYANWKQYFADFVTQIKAAMPGVEILHNSIFYSGGAPDGSEPHVQTEIKAAKWINRERGVSIGIDGTGGTSDPYSLISFLNFVDVVHSLGAYIDIQEFNFNGDYPVACYFLVSSGLDALGNDAIGMDSAGNPAPGSNGAPTNWPANYDVQLGTPLGARYTWNGMYRRDFTNGLVIVNPPGGSQGTYAISGSYRDVSGRATTSVSLPAKTGIVLLSTTAPALAVFTDTVPNGVVGSSYGSHALSATGGTPPYTWSVASGTLPAGLSLSAGGVLSGTPTTAATYNFTVRVTDSVSATATHAYTVLVNAASVPLAVATTSLRSGSVGAAYSQNLVATGGTSPYTWDLSAGSLPPGLTLSAGVISGSPTTAGTYSFTARVTDSVPNTATQALSIVIASGSSSPIQQVQSNSAEGSGVASVATAFSSNTTAHNTIIAFVRASTPTPTITLSDSAGNSYTLAVSQAQTTDSHSVWIYFATNIVGGADTVTASFAASNLHPYLAVFEYSGMDLICPLDQTATGTAGATASTNAATSSLTTTVANELLFAGVGENSVAGPAVTAGSGYTVQLADTANSRAAVETQTVSTIGTYSATATLASATTWSMALASFKAASTTPVNITTNSLPASEINVEYNQALLASAGTPPYVWSVASGSLPSGITLSSSGTVSGVTGTSGTYSFTAKVTDATSGTDTQALSIVIAGAPGVVTAGLPGGSVGAAYSQGLVSSGGIAPYTYALRTGALPPGLSLSSSGTVSGTPMVAGTYDFTVQMTDSANVAAPTAGEEIVIGTAPQASIQQVQSNSAEAFGVTSLSVAFPGANTSGNTIILFTRASTITPGITISDTLGNVYTLAAEETHNFNGAWDSAIYYAKNVKAGVNTVTATFATTNFHPWLAIYEYGGLDSVNPLDQVNVAESGSTQSTGPSVGSVTTTAANELLFAGIGLNTSSAVTVNAGTGYTAQLQDTATSRGFTETRMTNSAGLYNATATLSTADYWSMVLATFRAAAPTNATPLAVVTTSLPNGAVTSPYSQMLQATGGTTPYSWSVVSGTLPPGLTLVNGIIAGTPTTAGSYPFNVAATDSGSPPAIATQGETITVLPAAVAGAYNSVIGGKGALGGSAIIH